MTHHVPADLQSYVCQSIIPQYANFDKAHQIDHVEKVVEESLKLAMHYEVDYSMVYIIAAYHDLGLYEGREFHHIASGKVLLADETLRRWFTEEQLLQMKEAIEDHRASNKQAPRTIYGMIVAEADRIICVVPFNMGYPIIRKWIKRGNMPAFGNILLINMQKEGI